MDYADALDRLNPLSIGSVFPTQDAPFRWAGQEVLIPFLSGLFFQQEECCDEVRQGVLIPFLSGLFFQHYGNERTNEQLVLIPFLSGLFFQHSFFRPWATPGVLIPFLSGLFFQLMSGPYTIWYKS